MTGSAELAPSPAIPDAPRSQRTAVDRYNVVFAAVFITAVVSVAAMLTVAKPLGDHLLGDGGFRFFPSVQDLVYRKPAEQMRYLLAVACALGLGVVFVRMRVPGVLRAAPLGRATIRIASLGGQLAVVAVAVWGWWAQFHFSAGEPATTHFSNRNLVAAALVAGALILLVRARPHWLQERASGERRPLSWTWFAIAVLLTVCWLLPSVFREQNLAAASLSVTYHLRFTFDDFAAVANGRTPLVNYAEQYASLLPFAMWPVFRVAGTQVGVFTVTMCFFSMIGLLSVERVFSLITRSERLALALYAPFLATSLYFILREGSQLFSWGSYYAVFPMRYAGPYVLLWLYTRHLRGLRPKSTIAVFAFAGLVVLNNIEFGLSAYLGLVAATLISSKFEIGLAIRQIRDAAIGLAGAVMAVAALTLVLAGELPKIGLLTLYSRMFGEGGYGLLHTPTGGLYLIVDLTFATAFLVAAIRARDGAGDRAYTGVLAYCGVFGLGASNYYMGRTTPGSLVVLFSIWALCVLLLALLSLRAIAAWHGRLPAPVLLLFVSATVSLGLVTTALTQFPAPWTQLHRIETSAPSPPPYNVAASVSFLRGTARRGEPIVLLAPLGHVIALDADVENVSPYSNQEGVVTYQQLDEELAALHEAGGTKFYLADNSFPEIAQGLSSNGFSPTHSASGITEWQR